MNEIPEHITIEIDAQDAGQRLDKVLADKVADLSRARLQSLIADGYVSYLEESAAGGSLSPKQKVRDGQVYVVALPPALDPEPLPEDIPLDIIFEDDDLLVINKAPDMVVHPAPGNYSGTLVNALLAYCGDRLSGIGGIKRPGIVHRLDKETSGLMVVAKNDQAHQSLSAQLQDRSLSRVYHAVIWGALQPLGGCVETLIGRSGRDRKKMSVVTQGGKEAVTHYKTLQQYKLLASLVECRLETGRTHQIRVHMAHAKGWLIGDQVYGRPSVGRHLRGTVLVNKEIKEQLAAFPRQALHAKEIGFIHPRSGEKMHFTCDYADDIGGLINALTQFSKT